MSDDCKHENEKGTYCSKCAKAINTIMREPGEIKRMRELSKNILSLNSLANSKPDLMTLVLSIFIEFTFKWVSGEINDQDFIKMLESLNKKESVY